MGRSKAGSVFKRVVRGVTLEGDSCLGGRGLKERWGTVNDRLVEEVVGRKG